MTAQHYMLIQPLMCLDYLMISNFIDRFHAEQKSQTFGISVKSLSDSISSFTHMVFKTKSENKFYLVL